MLLKQTHRQFRHFGCSISVGAFAGLTEGYSLVSDILALGDFTESFVVSFAHYFYYSTVTYTTLGLSEFSPQELIKTLASIQALIRFIALTWSATFFYSLINSAQQRNQ